MPSLSNLPLSGCLALLTLCAGFACGEVDADAKPLTIAYGRNGSVGPDGPWWFIPQAVDYPDQYVQLLPAISELSLIVNSDACEDSTTCPLPLPTLWEQSDAWRITNGPDTISDDAEAGTWDGELALLLGMEGRGRYFQNRVTFYENGSQGDASYLDGVALMLSDSYTVSYSGGQSYTPDTGFFSLYGGSENDTWRVENGTRITRNRTLPAIYENGLIPSISYGLHVGSVYPEVQGSLVLGGYDSSRAVSEPIVSETDTFKLNTIGLSSVGDYRYYGQPEPSDNQLSTPGIHVSINPGAPYMYLPRETCDKLAEFLPVTYNEDFNLYFWDKSGDLEAYQQIVGSLHFMSFGFASSNNRTQDINVPFGILNLTLESPLVSQRTSFFPCSPLGDGQKATLGRAFLQAAFLAQNWQAERTYVAQAPGPGYQPEYVRTIASDDTLLAPATNPPTWASTWSETLPPWRDSSSSGGSSGLSGGAIAGVVVGVLVLVALCAGLGIWLFRRRRHRKSWTKPGDSLKQSIELAGQTNARTMSSYRKHEGQPVEIHEADAGLPAHEMDSGQQIGELPAQRYSRYDWKD